MRASGAISVFDLFKALISQKSDFFSSKRPIFIYAYVIGSDLTSNISTMEQTNFIAQAQKKYY